MEENGAQELIEGIETKTNKDQPSKQEKKIKKPIPQIKYPSKTKIKIDRFKVKHKVQIEFIKRFALYSITYGIPINYMVWAIFGLPFLPWGFPAYGVFWYLLSEELPPIKNKFFPPKR